MRAVTFSVLFVMLSSSAFAQADVAQMPGYLVVREGDAATPLKFNKQKLYFEWENNNYAYASDWPSEGAFLVLMPEDEKTNLKEGNLFGDFEKGFGGEVAIKDGNNDGIINSDEMVWPSLALWFDLNSNGYVERDEIKKLDADPDSKIDRNKAELSFEGKIYAFHAFLPVYNRINSRYTGDYTLDIDTLFLPTLRGYGTIPDLHIVASADDSLKQSLIKLCAQDPKEIFSATYLKRLDGEFAGVMYKWASVDKIDPKSRGPNFDARKLAVMEKFLGDSFSGIDFSGEPKPGAAKILEKAWTMLAGHSYSKVMAQCAGRKIFVPPMQYDFAADKVTLTPQMATLQTRANIDTILAGMADGERQTFWLTFEDFLKNIDPPKNENSIPLIEALKGPPSMLTEKKKGS